MNIKQAFHIVGFSLAHYRMTSYEYPLGGLVIYTQKGFFSFYKLEVDSRFKGVRKRYFFKEGINFTIQDIQDAGTNLNHVWSYPLCTKIKIEL